MTAEAFYLLRKDEPRTDLKDLDEVLLLHDVRSDDGALLPAGTDGTVVGVIGDGVAYIVEFSEPVGTLATVDRRNLTWVPTQHTSVQGLVNEAAASQPTSKATA